MIILKFGGSVITDKTTECCFKEPVVKKLAQELYQAQSPFILVHGAGSFGHIQAKQYALNDGYRKPSQLLGFTLTHMMVQKLNSLVLNTLYDQGIPCVGISPHSMIMLDDHKPTSFDTTILDQYLKLGISPVLFGDVVTDKSVGFSVCSGDLLLELLAKHYRPDKAIFVMDEDGLFSSNPKINPKAEYIDKASIRDLEKYKTTANTYDDVTKGMEGKLETIKHIAKLGIDTYLVNGNIHNRLYHTIVNQKTIHTHIIGEQE